MSRHAPTALSVSAGKFRVGIAAARYNERLVGRLLDQAVATLKEAGVKARNMEVVRVPGSNELPSAVQMLAAHRPDVLIALGVIIRGDTIHYELIATASAHALQQVALQARVPVVNGVIVTENEAQAKARCLGAANRGAEFARAAIEMAALRRRLGRSKS
jgi:6,7-dimethyl-8-ribityllumazine synthase